MNSESRDSLVQRLIISWKAVKTTLIPAHYTHKEDERYIYKAILLQQDFTIILTFTKKYCTGSLNLPVVTFAVPSQSSSSTFLTKTTRCYKICICGNEISLVSMFHKNTIFL